MTHKIAIIKSRTFENYSDYDDYSIQRIVETITDWEEVSDEDYRILVAAQSRHNFQVLEQPVDTKQFIAKTISEYREFVKAEEKRLAEEKRQREEAALQRKFKKELKDKASKEKMLAKLVAELGPDSVKTAIAAK